MGGVCQVSKVSKFCTFKGEAPLHNFKRKLNHFEKSSTLESRENRKRFRVWTLFLSAVVTCACECAGHVSFHSGYMFLREFRSVCFLGQRVCWLASCMPVQMNGATQAVGANFSNYFSPNAFTTMPIISKSHN